MSIVSSLNNSRLRGETHSSPPSLILRVMTAVAHHFQTIGLWLSEKVRQLKDRVIINLFPESIAKRLDPTSETFVQATMTLIDTVKKIDPEQQTIVLHEAFTQIAPMVDQQVANNLANLVNDPNTTTRKILNAVVSLPKSDRQSIVARVKQLIVDVDYLFCFKNLKDPFVKPVIKMVAALDLPINDTSTVAIYKKIAKMPSQERASCIENARRLFTFSDRKRDLIKILTDLPPDTRDVIVSQTIEIFQCVDRDSSNKHEIFEKLASLTDEIRKQSVLLARQIKNTPIEPMKVYQMLSVIQTIATLPSGERDVIVSQILEIGSQCTGLWYQETIPIIQTFASLSSSEIETVMQRMKQITATNKMPRVSNTSKMSICNIQKILAYVAALQYPEKVQNFCKNNFVQNASAINTVTNLAQNLEDQERENIFTLALQIINHPNVLCEHNDSLIDIFALIANLPSHEGAAGIDQLLQMICAHENERLSAQELRLITQTLFATPVEERAEIIQFSRDIVAHCNMHPNEPLRRAAMIQIVAQLSSPCRNEIIPLVKQVLRASSVFTTTQGIDAIIRAILNLQPEERNAILQLACQIMTPRMQPSDRILLIEQINRTAPDERVPLVNRLREQMAAERVQFAARVGMDVHAGARDTHTGKAIQLLRARQEKISQVAISRAVEIFRHYLNNCNMNVAYKQLAKRTLDEPQAQDEPFGPLIGGTDSYTISGMPVTGAEIIGRLWLFASELTEPEQTNAKQSMIEALKNSYEDGHRVCNPGKVQRLIGGVLGGRLQGVDIEELGENMQVTTNLAVAMFFNRKDHQTITALDPLLAAANKFCDENPAISRGEFLREIHAYADRTFN